ncbi:hypothetical protein PGB90_009275 [Kerria lacca]
MVDQRKQLLQTTTNHLETWTVSYGLQFFLTKSTTAYFCKQRTSNFSENSRTPSPTRPNTFPFSFHLTISPSLC